MRVRGVYISDFYDKQRLFVLIMELIELFEAFFLELLYKRTWILMIFSYIVVIRT